jgi:hypothetical protein
MASSTGLWGRDIVFMNDALWQRQSALGVNAALQDDCDSSLKRLMFGFRMRERLSRALD